MHKEWNTYFDEEKVEDSNEARGESEDVPPSLTDTPGKAARESVALPHTNIDFNAIFYNQKDEQN